MWCYVLLLSGGQFVLSNGCLTVLLCTVQLDSSLFTLFILKLSASAPSACDQLKAGRSFLQAPAIHEWGYHTLFYLQSAHLRKYFIIQFPGSKANASLFPLVLPISGDSSFSISLFTFVSLLFSGCQAPGKTDLTDLFIGTSLPALKCIEFVFEILQHCGNNVIPVLHTSVALPAVKCAQVPALPGSEPVAVPPILCMWVQFVPWRAGFVRKGSMK